MEKLKEKLWEELEELDRKPEIGPGDLELALDSATGQDREDIRRFMKKLENA